MVVPSATFSQDLTGACSTATARCSKCDGRKYICSNRGVETEDYVVQLFDVETPFLPPRGYNDDMWQ